MHSMKISIVLWEIHMSTFYNNFLHKIVGFNPHLCSHWMATELACVLLHVCIWIRYFTNWCSEQWKKIPQIQIVIQTYIKANVNFLRSDIHHDFSIIPLLRSCIFISALTCSIELIFVMQLPYYLPSMLLQNYYEVRLAMLKKSSNRSLNRSAKEGKAVFFGYFAERSFVVLGMLYLDRPYLKSPQTFDGKRIGSLMFFTTIEGFWN